MKMITRIPSLIIASVALYISAITLISTVKMNYYQNKRMELFPKPIAYEYSAKWYETANWSDRMLFFLPSIGLINRDYRFDNYPKHKKITDNWEGTKINATIFVKEEIKPYPIYLESPPIYTAHIGLSYYPNVYYGTPLTPNQINATK